MAGITEKNPQKHHLVDNGGCRMSFPPYMAKIWAKVVWEISAAPRDLEQSLWACWQVAWIQLYHKIEGSNETKG